MNSRQVCTLIAGAINTAPMAERAGLVPFVEDGQLRESCMQCIGTMMRAMVMDGGMDKGASDALLKQRGCHEGGALIAAYIEVMHVLRLARRPEPH